MKQDFHYVYEVYKEGSFSKAAEKLYITQPALSIAIKKIETSIGMPLFDRSKHSLKLTPAGKIYIDTVEKAINLDNEMMHQLSDIQNLNSGHLSIGGSNYINAYILPSIVAKFNNQYPGIELDIKEHSSSHLASMLSKHELDITFSCNEEFMLDFERYPAFNDYIILAIQTDHPINKSLEKYVLSCDDIKNGIHLSGECPSVTLDQFKNMEFILLLPGNNLYDRSMKMFNETGFQPKIKMQVSQLVTAYHLTEYFSAATFVSDRLVMRCESNLKYYKLGYNYTKRTFFMLLPKQNYTPIATKTFVEYFVANINS